MPDSLRSTAKVFCFRRESYRPNATLRITRLKANRPEKSQAACQPSSTSREERVCPALVPHKTPIVFILGSCQSSTRQVTRFGALWTATVECPEYAGSRAGACAGKNICVQAAAAGNDRWRA